MSFILFCKFGVRIFPEWRLYHYACWDSYVHNDIGLMLFQLFLAFKWILQLICEFLIPTLFSFNFIFIFQRLSSVSWCFRKFRLKLSFTKKKTSAKQKVFQFSYMKKTIFESLQFRLSLAASNLMLKLLHFTKLKWKYFFGTYYYIHRLRFVYTKTSAKI